MAGRAKENFPGGSLKYLFVDLKVRIFKCSYRTLHYTTLRYNYNYTTTLHYTPLRYTTLHYTTLHYIPLHSTTLHYTTLHYTEWHCTTDRQVDR